MSSHLSEEAIGNQRSAGKLIVVLGMHRSGTSALSGALHSMGIWMGQRLMPAKAGENDRGFFEHESVVAVNDAILRACGLLWDTPARLPEQWWQAQEFDAFRGQIRELMNQEFVGRTLSAIKDPRMCRTLPIWQSVWREMHFSVQFIHMLRHPHEVALSLQRRDAMSGEAAADLWRLHVAEAAAHAGDGAVCTYDQLINDPGQALESIVQHLDLDCVVANIGVSEFISAGLRHHRHHSESTDAETQLYSCIDASTSMQKAWTLLHGWAQQQSAQPWPQQLAALENSAKRLGQAFNTLQTEYAATDAALGGVKQLCVERLEQWQSADQALRKNALDLQAALVERESMQLALAELGMALKQAVVDREQLGAALAEAQQFVRERESEVASLHQTLVAQTTQYEALRADLESVRAYLASVYRFSWMRIKDGIRRLLRS